MVVDNEFCNVRKSTSSAAGHNDLYCLLDSWKCLILDFYLWIIVKPDLAYIALR